MDRVIQQAVAQVLTPIFDPTFSESSFGFRPGRKPCRPHPRQRRGLFMLSNSAQALLEPQHSAHQAIRQVQATVQEGRTIAVDIDLAKFFDTVNHDVLMTLLAKTIGDKALLTLIGRYLRAGAEPGHKAS